MSHDWFRLCQNQSSSDPKERFQRQTTLRIMPILRQPTQNQPGSNQGFQSSVSSVPMAMSMMIDSMVNMVQNSRPAFKAEPNITTK